MSNHYQILEIFPGSSQEEIRRAYRRLALKYHPDRNQGDERMARRFIEVNQAYETLSDPVLRDEYDKNNGFNVWKKERITNPVNIYQQALKLHHYVKKIDTNFIDREALLIHLTGILSDYHLELVSSNEELKTRLLKECIAISRMIKFHSLSSLVNKFNFLAEGNKENEMFVRNYLLERKRLRLYEKLVPLMVILLTMILCLMIYLVAK